MTRPQEKVLLCVAFVLLCVASTVVVVHGDALFNVVVHFFECINLMSLHGDEYLRLGIHIAH